MIGQTRFTPAFMENTMLHGSWFLPQLYHATSVGGKNCGEAKAEKRRRAAPLFRQREAANGVPGFPRPHDLAARQAARYVSLTITTVLTAERRCLIYALCDFTF